MIAQNTRKGIKICLLGSADFHQNEKLQSNLHYPQNRQNMTKNSTFFPENA